MFSILYLDPVSLKTIHVKHCHLMVLIVKFIWISFPFPRMRPIIPSHAKECMRPISVFSYTQAPTVQRGEAATVRSFHSFHRMVQPFNVVKKIKLFRCKVFVVILSLNLYRTMLLMMSSRTMCSKVG